MNARPPARLTLGPLLFHWPARKRRDFYLRIADEAPVDTVYLGEVVCSKRESEFAAAHAGVIERLRAAGKEVVLSTLALVTTPAEVAAIRALTDEQLLVEANDVATVQLLGGRPFVVGPYINVFNEGARDFLLGRGAVRIVLPVEMPAKSIAVVAGADTRAEYEVQVFGRQPLSVAMRCYHARAHQRTKDHCQLVCGLDPDGLTARTIDGSDILTVNGTQTLTHGHAVLLAELAALRASGVRHFRLSPQDLDMVRVATLYRDVLDARCAAPEALALLRTLTGTVPYINGFLQGRAGLAWTQP
ncbi:MAG: U32 family peptidase [Gammaproteobacteria bacterium]|nr:U32 family peptidase [Gammaproteobacteria bacterium]